MSLYFGPAFFEEAQANSTKDTYLLGSDRAAKGQNLQEACGAYSDNNAVFCFEGYFYKLSLMDLNNPELSIEQIFKRHLGILKAATPAEWILWAVPFGIAIPDSKRELAEVTRYFRQKEPLLLKYVADGWALTFFNLYGLEATLKTCAENFGDDILKMCAFGAGRASFLYHPAAKPPESTNQDFINGFNFARSFTRLKTFSDRQINSMTFFPQKTAEIVKRVHAQNAPKGSEFRQIFDCFYTKHVTECEALVTPQRLPSGVFEKLSQMF